MKQPIFSWKRQGESSHRQSISRQVTAFLFLIFALLLTIGIFVLIYIRGEYAAGMEQVSIWSATGMMADVDSILKSTESAGDLFIGDAFMQDRLSVIKDDANPLSASAARRDVQSRLGIMIDAVDYVSDIAVHDGSALLHYGSGIALSNEALGMAMNEALAMEGRPFWLAGDNGEVYYVRAIRRAASLALDDLGVLLLRLELGEALSSLWEQSGLSGAVDIYCDGQLMYTDGFVPDG